MKLRANLFSDTPSAELVARTVSHVLHDTSLCAVASVAEDGAAHINTAYFAADADLCLYLLTAPSTVHAQNWLTNPSTAVAIFSTAQPWGQPHRGLQLFGSAARIPESGQGKAFAVYAAKHPALLKLAASEDALLRDLESRFFEIRIDMAKVTDEDVFGEDPVAACISRDELRKEST